MANSDKNIIITPNVGSASDPQIVFSGASPTLGPQNITVRAYPTSNGTLSFEGTAGQLFSITNDLSGTIFSVNDVSGIPSIEVLATGLVKIAQYSGRVLMRTGTDNGTSTLQVAGGVASSSTITGTVVVTGGVGVSGQVTATTFSGNVAGGTGAFTTLTSNAATTFTAGTASSSTVTGTVVVTGGVGISGNLNVGGSFTTSSIQNTPIGSVTRSTGAFTTLTSNAATTFTAGTASSSTVTGTLVVTGGVGISGNLNVGGSFATGSINNTPIGNITPSTGAFTTLSSNSTTTLGVTTATSLNNTPIGATTRSTGAFTTLGSNSTTTLGVTTATSLNSTPIGATTRSTGAFTTLTSNAATTFTAGTASSSTTTGTVVVTGGVGVSGAMFLGSTLNVAGNNITMAAVATRDKYRVWTDTNYTIGMMTPFTFGAINNDYAMTFQMNDAANRGFWWGDAAHTGAQGAMSLSTTGRLTVAHSLRAGYGEADTTVPGATYRLDVSGDGFISGKMRIGTPFWENTQTISANYTVPAATNTMSIGPITIADGVTVTVSDGSSWSIV